MPIKTIKISSVGRGLAAALLGLIALCFIFYSVRWLLGNSISTQVQSKEVAEFAVAMAPSDPQTRFALAAITERTFLPEDLPKSLSEYEKAAALSPSDFRFWLALGKARERSGDPEGAELALRKALELAPNYAQVNWTYGNVLLRREKTEQAFKYMRLAVENDAKFANPAATTMWQIFDGDIEKIKKTIGDSNPVNSALATFLAQQEKFEEALSIWNDLPAEERKDTLKNDGERLLTLLLRAKRYLSAVEVDGQLNEDGPRFKVGSVHNGGFESNVKLKNSSPFEWKIPKGTQPRINLTGNEKKDGDRSLVLAFDTLKRSDFRAIAQTIAVIPGRSYSFSSFYRSELEAEGSVIWEVVDLTAKKVIASTEPVQLKSGWELLETGFEVPEGSEGIEIRLARTGCVAKSCRIRGRLWFDEIKLD